MMLRAFLASLALSVACAAAADSGIALGRSIEALEDPGGALRLEEVLDPENARRFAAHSSEIANFGYTHSAYWLRFKVARARGADARLLEVRFPSLDEVDLYAPRRGAGHDLVRVGDLQPFAARPVKHRNFVFPLDVPEGEERDFLLRVRSSGALTVPVYLWGASDFADAGRHDQLVYGAFYGLAVALVLYNLMLFLAVRDRAYLFYVLYGGAFTLYLFCFDGYAFEYLWPESVWWANHALATALSLTLALGALFARAFLAMPDTAPRAGWLLAGIAASGFLLALASATGWLIAYGMVLRTLSVLGFVAAGTTLGVAVVQWLQGFRPARFFLFAWSALLVFIAVGALRNFALMPTNFVTIHGLHIGFALDILLLSFALADRIGILKREAERSAALDRTNEQLREREQSLRFMAQHDALTGLPNRHSMQQRLTLAIELAKRNRKMLAVMLVDLDGFKRLNDTRGHLTGDRALIQIAERLRTSVRGSDTVARYGGDEFVILAGELDRAEDAGIIAEKVADMVGAPLPVEGRLEAIGCSIGISLYPHHAEDGERLIELADRAMYAAKARQGQRVAYFAEA